MKSKLFYNIARYLLAALFLFSGFAKGVNPFGLSIQFEDYFAAMGLSFLRPMAVLCAIALPAAEMFIGLMLIYGVFSRFFAWTVAIFMGFFTVLTLWIAIFNPVKDCGCFGDLLVISNWATFFKNIFFDFFAYILFINRQQKPKPMLMLVVAALAVSFVLPIRSYSRLPFIDATPYKIGVNIPTAMVGNRSAEGHTTLIYRNLETGKTEKFEITDTTWQDTAKWEYVDSQTTTINDGYRAPIQSFSLFDESGIDVAPHILDLPSVRLFVVPDPQKLSDKEVKNISLAAEISITAGDSVYLLHSSITVPQIKNVRPLGADQTMLRTMIQHNVGGVMVLRKGTIEQKYLLSEAINFANQK